MYTFITHELALASNADTLFTYGLSPRLYFFKSCTNNKYINRCYTRTLFFSHIWYSNSNITFEINFYPRQYRY